MIALLVMAQVGGIFTFLVSFSPTTTPEVKKVSMWLFAGTNARG